MVFSPCSAILLFLYQERFQDVDHSIGKLKAGIRIVRHRWKGCQNYLALFMLNPKAVKGYYGANPFTFHTFGLQEIRLELVDDDREIKLDTSFTDSTGRIKAFMNNIMAVYGLQDISCPSEAPFTFERFLSGYTIFFFDIRGATPLLCPVRHLVHTGRLRLHVTFKETLKENVDMITVGFFDAVMLINRNREADVFIPRH